MDRNGVKNSLLGTQKWDLVPSSGSAKEAAAQTSGLAISQPANITETVKDYFLQGQGVTRTEKLAQVY